MAESKEIREEQLFSLNELWTAQKMAIVFAQEPHNESDVIEVSVQNNMFQKLLDANLSSSVQHVHSESLLVKYMDNIIYLSDLAVVAKKSGHTYPDDHVHSSEEARITIQTTAAITKRHLQQIFPDHESKFHPFPNQPTQEPTATLSFLRELLDHALNQIQNVQAYNMPMEMPTPRE